ncbi:MAG TPA: hypothetical protein PLV27_06150 [Anaerolineaceae bacterium]|nr:hypothetical protein [Anaerolineaceae bacterium]
MNAAERSRLLYRRQYIYGLEMDGFSNWNHLHLPNGYTLASHPDLDCTRLQSDGKTLVLLGYMLDPYAPEVNNQTILANLCREADDQNRLLERLDSIAGRFILFVFSDLSQYVVTDATGLRQVFYHRTPQGALWLAAQPGLLQQQFNFQYSAEAQSFLQSPAIVNSHEPWWPGTSTPFAEISHLLPNHVLDLRSGEVRRFWPVKPLVHQEYHKGAEKSATLLKGIMRAANQRFDLAMALTGGYDSRIVFAACREFVTDLHLFSMIYHKLTTQSSDIRVAAQLAEIAQMPHQVFACDQAMDEDFAYLYTHNLEKSYQSYGHIVYGRYLHLDQKLVVVKSVVNEIARCFYYRTGVYPYRINTELLCRVSKLGDHPFVQKHLSAWLDDAAPAEKLGYKLLDLYYWENRNANWQAMSQLEFDLANEEFTPFDHRELLTTMLGVNHKYRCMPKNRFQRELVRQSWLELDAIPYNPTSKVIRKPFYEGPWLNAARWIKYHLITR